MEQYETEIIELAPDKAVIARDTLEVARLTTNIHEIFWYNGVIRTRGKFEVTFHPDPPVVVRPDSQVAVSITELNRDGDPFLAEARMGIWNVVPGDGTITVRGNIDWPSPLRCRLNLIIVW
jgi:hypothetical protein